MVCLLTVLGHLASSQELIDYQYFILLILSLINFLDFLPHFILQLILSAAVFNYQIRIRFATTNE